MDEYYCKLKICGLFRPLDIAYVNGIKPDYAGFIINFPKSYRSISFQTAQDLIPQLCPSIQSVCVFVDQDIDYILQYRELAHIIQLHGHESNDFINQLKAQLPDKEIWKAFKITSEEDLTQAQDCTADTIILDNGYGTGQTFDWSCLATFQRPFILAGGLCSNNILNAIEQYHPLALDISSGVEENHIKNKDKITQIATIMKPYFPKERIK